jgi:hypothetical protein
MATWDNTILGQVQIDGNSLVAEVNSVQRAERLRAEIEKRLGAAAVHQNTAIVTQEDMIRNANQRGSNAESDDDCGAAVLRDPEARRTLQQFQSFWTMPLPPIGVFLRLFPRLLANLPLPGEPPAACSPARPTRCDGRYQRSRGSEPQRSPKSGQ